MIAARISRALARLARSERAALRLGLAIGAAVAAVYLAIGVHHRPGGGVAVEGRDTYLHYQYAAALAQGHPYAFMPGDAPSTGGTSQLYPALLAVFHALGARGDALSVAGAGLAAASLLACIALVSAIARRLAPGALAPAVVLAAASGHLAIALFDQTDAVVVAPLALGAFAALVYRRRGWLRLALVALPFARPDGVVVALALLGVAALGRALPSAERRDLAASAGLGIAGFVALLALHAALTGDLLPHSAQAKGLLHDWPPAGALALAAQAAAKLFAELVAGSGDGARRMLWLPGVGGALVLAGLYARSRDAAPVDRVFALAALGLLAVGIASGGSGLHRDRYLVWVLALAWVYAGAGAAAVAAWTRQPRLFAWLVAALVGFQLVGAVYMAASFASGAAETASSVRFAKQLDASLPVGSRIGVASGAGLAYFMPRHHVTNVNGIVSPGFAHPGPNVMGVEILRARPELRFDHWLLRPSSLRDGWYRPFLGAARAREAPEIVGADALTLLDADWSSLDAAPPADGALARLEVGLADSERRHGYRARARVPGARIEPALVGGRLDGRPHAEVGRVIRGGESFRVPAPASGRLALTLRTAAGAEALVRHGTRAARQRFRFEAPLALAVRVAGVPVAAPELALDPDPERIQRLRFELEVPGERRGGDPLAVEVDGDYLSLGWSFDDAAELR